MSFADLPLILLSAAFLAPLVVGFFGFLFKTRVSDRLAMPLLSLALLAASTISALVIGRERAGIVLTIDLILLGLFVVLAVLNVVVYLRIRRRFFESVQPTSDDARRGPDQEISDKERGGQFDCRLRVFQDTPNPSLNYSVLGNDSILTLALPANFYIYFLSISFRLTSDTLEVIASANGLFRPPSAWFSFFFEAADKASFRRAESRASGMVRCDKRETGCVISAIATKPVNARDVEYSTAAAVDIRRDDPSDPASITLEATGAAAFVGQKSVEAITIETKAEMEGLQVQVKTTIKLPTVHDKGNSLSRTVKFRCVRIER